MQWCRFQAGDTTAYGIIENGTVTAVTGSPFERYTRTSTMYPLSAVKLLVPVIPPTFYAAGINYREHVIEMARKRGRSRNSRRKPTSAIEPITPSLPTGNRL